MSEVEKTYSPQPKLSDLGLDLLKVTPLQRAFTVLVPFVFACLYFYAASSGNWVVGVACLIFLSFVTYGSTSHDLVHRNLGLTRTTNELFLTIIELLALRSGHAYRMAHLHHHARFPHDDDVEADAAKKTFLGALLDGITFHPRLWFWAMKRARQQERKTILFEGIAVLVLIVSALAVVTISWAPLIYVLLMIAGAWITPLVTSYIPHAPHAAHELEQTRVFRGRIASLIALEHLYHLEHHLYPAVPHQNWPILARRLDPYFSSQGIKPIVLGF